MVALAAGHALRVDAVEFEAAARRALDRDPPDVTCLRAAWSGTSRPSSFPTRVEEWVEEHRDRHRRWSSSCWCGGAWEALLRLDPVNEAAHLGLLRSALRRGDRAAGLRDVLLHGAGARGGAAGHARCGRGRPAGCPDLARRRAGGPEPTAPPRARGALVERGRELGSLRAWVAAATATGHGSVALVSGDAGVGKSALVRALVDGLPDGVAAHVGGCDDLLAPRSLGPFQDIVADAGDADVRATVQGGTMDEVLPALLAFLGRGPCVAVVEDLHWADDATLDAVRYLARRVTHLPVVLVATFRSRGLAGDHPLTRLLGSLLGDHVVRLPLEPLSVGAVRDLGGFGDDEAAEVHRITGGNPFFVTEVIAAGVDAVPTTVRDAVLGRIAGLAPEVRELLRTLSVVPGRAERWLAEALATGSETLVAAEASGVLLGEPDSLSFHHELARRAVESSLTATERRAPTARSSTRSSTCPGCPGPGWSTTLPSVAGTGCWWRSVRRRPRRRRARGRIASAPRSSGWCWRARRR